MTKKVVLKLEVRDEKEKTKAMKSVSSIPGIESLSMDMKEKKLTVIGDVDPVKVVGKLKKSWHTELLTVGPPKEPEKKDDEKKNDVKKDDEKKGDEKKDDDKKKESEQIAELLKLYKNQFPHYTQYYRVYSAEENPNSCVIC